jgi:hypothetical protein
MMTRAGHVTRMGEKRNAYKFFAGKHEGKRPLEKPRRRIENNNEILNLRFSQWRL